MTDVAANLAALDARIAAACARAGRDRAEVRLVAVSKRQPPAAIAAAEAAGHRDFGESYAQELGQKIAALGGGDRRWHFVGKLQRNKVKDVVGAVAVIHAVDSARLLEAIDRVAGERGVVQPLLIAVNVGGEAQKSGVAPDQAGALVAAAGELANVDCRGLMTMPPWPESPEDSRPHFAALAALRQRLASAAAPLPELSMGTTADLEVAVEEGATLVRVGTAVFGPRS